MAAWRWARKTSRTLHDPFIVPKANAYNASGLSRCGTDLYWLSNAEKKPARSAKLSGKRSRESPRGLGRTDWRTDLPLRFLQQRVRLRGSGDRQFFWVEETDLSEHASLIPIDVLV